MPPHAVKRLITSFSGVIMDDPIGVFDSGVGGLTVLDAIQTELPNESVVYLGDTARVPYGNRTPQTIVRYALECAEVLVSRGVKAIVIACNTASAHALDVLQCELTIPVFGVIDPVSEEAVKITQNHCIGLIGTRATVASGAYERAIHLFDPQARIVAQACPLFASLAEEDWADHEVTYLTALEYLKPFKSAPIVPDTLILGCTHYPILKPAITRALNTLDLHMTLCDCARATAHELHEQLRRRDLLSHATQPGHTEYLVTDAPAPFAAIGASFMSRAPQNVKHIDLV